MRRLLISPSILARGLAALALGTCCFAVPQLAAAGETAAGRESLVRSTHAEIENPAELLPSNVLFYLHIADSAALVELGQDERIWNELEQIGDVKRSLESEEFQQFQQVVKRIENRLGASWPELINNATDGGIHLGFEPLQQSALLIVKAKDAQQLAALHQELLDLYQAASADNPDASPPAEIEFRGATGWSLGPQEFHCIVDNMLLLSNKETAVNLMLDRLNGKGFGGSLAEASDFKLAAQAGADKTLWGFARLGPLRIFPQFNQAISGESNNPVAELIAGGVLDVLGSAPYTIFTAQVADGDLQLHVELPYSKDNVSDRRGWYFAEGDASARPLLDPPETIFALSTYRDFSRFWLSRDDLFEEVTLANLSQADTNLGTFFTGLEFGRDVLGSFEPGMRLVVARQNFAEGQPVPAARFPAVGIVMEMKDPDTIFPQMLASYQKTIGVVNIVGGMNGQPTLLIGSEEHAGTQISKATYLPAPNTRMDAAPVQYNASPSCLRVGNHFVITSTTELARQLVDVLKSDSDNPDTGENTLVTANFDALGDVLAENKAALVAQNMLEEGNSQDQAEEQISLLIRLLQHIDPASLSFGVEDENKLVLELSLGLKD